MCCLAEVCPQGIRQLTGNLPMLTSPKIAGPCPYLAIDERGTAACGLVTTGRVTPVEIGSGRGCCMAARIMRATPSGTMVMDYPSLPAADKVRYVATVMDRKGVILHTHAHRNPEVAA